MKRTLAYLTAIIIANFSFAQLPDGFVYVKDFIPDITTDLRYFTTDNFVGKRIDGYNNNCLILTKATVFALKQVQIELATKTIGLKIFDGYRPQQAVDHFMRWANDLNDTVNKTRFYPNVDKVDLFKEEYIATRSGHTKGSTVDVTLINLATGEELDMGSPYDFFGKQSWITHQDISQLQKSNRALLQHTMLKHGFRNYTKEWWHFTLKNEPFPNTYFNFPIE